MSGQLEKSSQRGWPARLLALVLACLTMTAMAAPASAAKLIFGADEELRHLQDVELKTRDGEALYLGYKLAFHWIGLPYAMTDGGYILGVKGQNRYYSIDNDLMKEWQAQGYLPATLPKYQIKAADYIMAHLLWIALGLLATFYAARALLTARTRPVAVPPTAIEPSRLAAATERRVEAKSPPREALVQPKAPSTGLSLPAADIAKLPVAKTLARVKSLKQ